MKAIHPIRRIFRRALVAAGAALAVAATLPVDAAAPRRITPPDWGSSLVTLEVTGKEFDMLQPWFKQVGRVSKSGVVVAPREILTTADHLSNRTLVRVQKSGRGRWWNAEVVWTDYHANLALITVEDDALWRDLRPAILAERIRSDAAWQIIRWRDGNLETRRTEFSQFVVDEGSLSFAPHVQMDLSTEIQGVGWSEPLVAEGQVVGLITSQSGSVCRALPAPFVRRILEARRKDAYTGLGYFPFTWQPTENPEVHDYLGLEGEPRGVVVIHVPRIKGREPLLQRLDLLLEVNGFAIDVQGYYRDPDYGHLILENLATRSKWAGQTLPIKVWREGREIEIEYRLPRVTFEAELVPRAVVDQEPEYLIIGGLVFQPLTEEFLRSWGGDWARRAPFRLTYFQQEPKTRERPSVVVLSGVLPDAYTLGYQDYRFLAVDQVNGHRISTLNELQEALRRPTDGFHLIEFIRGDSLQRLVVSAQDEETATQRVLERYGINQARVLAQDRGASKAKGTSAGDVGGPHPSQ